MSSNNENTSFDFNGLKRVLQIGAQSKVMFWSVVFVAVFSACFSVYRPYLTGNIIDDYIQTKDLPGLQMQIVKLSLVLVFEGILSFFMVYLANVVAQRVIRL